MTKLPQALLVAAQSNRPATMQLQISAVLHEARLLVRPKLLAPMENSMPNDTFSDTIDSVIAPARECFPITPNDGEDLPAVTKALYIGQSGDLAVTTIASESPTMFTEVPAGTILPIRALRVHATGTSAAGIVGLC